MPLLSRSLVDFASDQERVTFSHFFPSPRRSSMPILLSALRPPFIKSNSYLPFKISGSILLGVLLPCSFKIILLKPVGVIWYRTNYIEIMWFNLGIHDHERSGMHKNNQVHNPETKISFLLRLNNSLVWHTSNKTTTKFLVWWWPVETTQSYNRTVLQLPPWWYVQSTTCTWNGNEDAKRSKMGPCTSRYLHTSN